MFRQLSYEEMRVLVLQYKYQLKENIGLSYDERKFIISQIIKIENIIQRHEYDIFNQQFEE